MTVKALFFDIDGTLLNSKGFMDKETYNALQACSDKGFIISIVTARSGRIVFRKQDIPWEHPFLLKRGIFYNGGTRFDNIHNFYQHIALPGNLVKSISECVSVYNDDLQIALQHDNEYHSYKFEMNDADLLPWGFARNELIDFKIASVKPTTKMMIYDGLKFEKISSDLSALYLVLCKQFASMANIILTDSKRSVYITSKFATKCNGIKQIAELYDIDPGEIAVFGDDTSDIDMFGSFGYSIAMGNAIDEIKRKASFVTLTNNELGVVHALKNYLKII